MLKMIDSKFFKVIVLGNSNVGKTSLMSKYVKNVFINSTKYTMGADFSTKELVIGNTYVTMQIWDTAGQERFQSICASYYRGSDCCVLVYDVTNAQSFENLSYWFKQFLDNAAPKYKEHFPVVVVGNKVDLPSRQVSTIQAEEWCNSKMQCPYYETSAKDGINVDFAFQRIAEMALRRVREPNQYFPRDCVFPKKKNTIFDFKMC